MSSGEKYMVSLRKHVFEAPHPAVALSIFLFVLFIFSYIAHPQIGDVLFLFLFPAIFALFLDWISIRALRIYFPLRRITTLHLLVFLVSFVEFWLLSFFVDFTMSFFVGFSFPIFLRYLIYRTFVAERKNFAMLISSYYNIGILIFAVAYLNEVPLVQYILSTLTYGVAGHVFIITSTSVFRREFREDPLFFISTFVNYISRHSADDESKLNKMFHSMYTKRKVPVSVMVFHKNSGEKYVFVAPYIHPGPFGNLGGSNVSGKLENILHISDMMVFHTTTTHDNNVDNEDIEKIAEVIKRAINDKCVITKFSEPKRGKVDGIEYMAQRFGDYMFVSLIPNNAQFDDVELSTGLHIRSELMKNMNDAMIIDAHNCFDENAVPLSLLGADVGALTKSLLSLKANFPIVMGYGHVNLKGRSIGPGGVRAAVFKVGNKRFAYILIDGNNIKKGLRDRIRKEIKEVDDSEVFSTDNHIVNMSMVDLNPVGEHDDWTEIINACKKAVEIAIKNEGPACASFRTEEVEFLMANTGNLELMSAITKKSVARAKIAAGLLLTASFVVSLLIFFLIK